MLNLVERLDKLVCECVDPLVEVFLYVDECATDLRLPYLNERHVGSVLNDSLACHLLDALEFLLVQLVLLVEINQTLVIEHAQVAFPFTLLFGVKDSRPVMHLAIQVQVTVGVFLFFLYEECIFELFS
jgi:hypothetical protein